MMRKILSALLLISMFVVSSSAASAANISRAVPTDIPGISIVPGSKINLVSRESNIPVKIKNEFDADIRVHVHIIPSNSRVIVPTAVEVVVPALTSINAKVPVRAIANGDVTLSVWLTTFSGLRLGEAVDLEMNVNPDAELTLIISFGAFVILLGTAGVIRTVNRTRRRQEKTLS